MQDVDLIIRIYNRDILDRSEHCGNTNATITLLGRLMP